jgi:hypothetical protein
MFDPTIFENIKVAIENQVYDLDNLTGQVEVINRKDQLEMAVMSREFALEFILSGKRDVRAEIVLFASLKDLAAEILETDPNPGCTLFIRFYKQIKNVQLECKQIEELLQDIWKQEQVPTQTLSFLYGKGPAIFENKMEITFNRQINESQMGDIPELLKYILHTLEELNAI